MHDIPGCDDMTNTQVVINDQLSIRRQIGGPADQFARRQFDPHPRPDCGGMGAQLLDDAGRVRPPLREFPQQGAQHGVAVSRPSGFDDRGRPVLTRHRRHVDPDPDDNARHGGGDELGEHSGEFAGGGAIGDHQVVRPLHQHPRGTQRIDRGAGGGAERTDQFARLGLLSGNPETEQEGGTGIVDPLSIQPTTPGGLMIRHQHRTARVAASSLVDEIRIRRPGLCDMTQRTGADVVGYGCAERQKPGRGCRTGGVHSTNN